MAFKKCNDGASDNATPNDFIVAGIPATNDWSYSHDDKCQILANRPPSHQDQPRYPPHPNQERQLADGVAVAAVRPYPAGFLEVHSSLPVEKRHEYRLS